MARPVTLFTDLALVRRTDVTPSEVVFDAALQR